MDDEIRRQLTIDRIDVTSEQSEANPRYRVIASTPTAARDGLSIPTSAWQLDAFRNNPALTWGHESSSLPIGTVPAVQVHRDRLEAEIEFAAIGSYDFADQVHRLWDAGVLKAVSVGARVLEPPRVVRNADGTTESVLDAVELTHLAVVTIGSDPEALALARSLDLPEQAMARLFDSPLPLSSGHHRSKRAAARIAVVKARRRSTK